MNLYNDYVGLCWMSSVKSEMIGLYCGMIGLYSENAIF
jgi:hypothetical protein